MFSVHRHQENIKGKIMTTNPSLPLTHNVTDFYGGRIVLAKLLRIKVANFEAFGASSTVDAPHQWSILFPKPQKNLATRKIRT